MSENIVKRDAQGHWLPGQSANPGGLPVGVGEVRAWARQVWQEKGRAELERLALHAKKEEVRLRALIEICDRAFGRPPQQLQHTGFGDGPLMLEPGGALVSKLAALLGEAHPEPEALPAVAAELVPGTDEDRAP